MAGRFDAFTQPERDAMYDGLMYEAKIDEAEDPEFGERVRVANELLVEISEASL